MAIRKREQKRSRKLTSPGGKSEDCSTTPSAGRIAAALLMSTHAVAVPADVDHGRIVEQTDDDGSGHHAGGRTLHERLEALKERLMP